MVFAPVIFLQAFYTLEAVTVVWVCVWEGRKTGGGGRGGETEGGKRGYFQVFLLVTTRSCMMIKDVQGVLAAFSLLHFPAIVSFSFSSHCLSLIPPCDYDVFCHPVSLFANVIITKSTTNKKEKNGDKFEIYQQQLYAHGK